MEKDGKPIVLIAGPDPLARTGGHMTYVHAHALAAAAAGFVPHIFCVASRRNTEVTDFAVLHRIAARLQGYQFSSLHTRLLAPAVASFLASRPGPHLIHSFAGWAGAGVAASRELARLGIRNIAVASAYATQKYEVRAKLNGLASAHGIGQIVRYHRRYLWILAVADRAERRGYNGSDLVLVNYESVRRLLRASGCATEIRRLPYASAAAFTSIAETPGGPLPDVVASLRPFDAPLVVAVSRHDPRKGLNLLLTVLSRLAARGTPFRAALVGEGPLLAAHRKLVEDLGLRERVTIPGRVEDVFAYLRHAQIFVLPSLIEGSGSVALLEALQAGLAIVASRCDGIPEDLVDGEDALLVEPGNIDALEAALAELLADPLLRARLAERARLVYDERFSAAGFVAALKNTYAELGVFP